jgi:hypothetical protein
MPPDERQPLVDQLDFDNLSGLDGLCLPINAGSTTQSTTPLIRTLSEGPLDDLLNRMGNNLARNGVRSLENGFGPAPSTPPVLATLRVEDPLSRNSAQLIFETLRAVPLQMARRETFPCFIHPHWEPMRLPEPIAICMRIAQLFSTRTPDITPFLWRTIVAQSRHIMAQAG